MHDFLETLLANSLVAGCLAVGGALVWRLTHRSPVAHALFLLALIKLVTPPLFDVGFGLGLGADPAPQPEFVMVPVEATGPLGPVLPDAVASIPAVIAPPAVAPATGFPIALALFATWALGSLVTVLLLWRRGRLCHRLLSRADAAPTGVQQIARRLAEQLQLKSYPEVRVIDARISPCVLALGRRAMVVLPRHLLASVSAGDLRAVLAHELSHIANRDHLTRWLEVAVSAVHWWNPIAWWIRRHLDELGEMRCDARAVEVLADGPRSYGHAILRVTSQLEVDPAAVPLGASGFGGSKVLKRRITMIAESKLTHRLNWPTRCAVVAGALGLLPLGLTAQEKEKSKKDALGPKIFKALEEQGVLTDEIRAAINKALANGKGVYSVRMHGDGDAARIHKVRVKMDKAGDADEDVEVHEVHDGGKKVRVRVHKQGNADGGEWIEMGDDIGDKVKRIVKRHVKKHVHGDADGPGVHTINLGGTVVVKIVGDGKPAQVRTLKMGGGKGGSFVFDGENFFSGKMQKKVEDIVKRAKSGKGGVWSTDGGQFHVFRQKGDKDTDLPFFDSKSGKSMKGSGNVFFMDGKGEKLKALKVKKNDFFFDLNDGKKAKGRFEFRTEKGDGKTRYFEWRDDDGKVIKKAPIRWQTKQKKDDGPKDLEAELEKLQSEVERLRKQIRALRKSKML